MIRNLERCVAIHTLRWSRLVAECSATAFCFVFDSGCFRPIAINHDSQSSAQANLYVASVFLRRSHFHIRWPTCSLGGELGEASAADYAPQRFALSTIS